MWGRWSVKRLNLDGVRFTPTYVGPVQPPGSRCSRAAVHPHVCGAGSLVGRPSGGMLGSPPRMWGRSPVRGRIDVADRFTPTYVGPVLPLFRATRLPPVHPHVCGAGVTSAIVTGVGNGSPPRMWGRFVLRHGSRFVDRFTPTYVGPVLRSARNLDSVSHRLSLIHTVWTRQKNLEHQCLIQNENEVAGTRNDP